MRIKQITLWKFDLCWISSSPKKRERAKYERLNENEKLKLLILHNDSSGVWSTIFLGICLVQSHHALVAGGR